MVVKRWENNIRMYIKDMDQWWALVKVVMKVWVPKKAENFLTS
jgi:hypothetical protein